MPPFGTNAYNTGLATDVGLDRVIAMPDFR